MFKHSLYLLNSFQQNVIELSSYVTFANFIISSSPSSANYSSLSFISRQYRQITTRYANKRFEMNFRHHPLAILCKKILNSLQKSFRSL